MVRLAQWRGWSLPAWGSGAEGWVCQTHQTCCWQKSNAEALSEWTIKGLKIGEVRLIVMKEITETTATQTLGGLELSSRGSVAIYTTSKLALFCIWEYLSPYQYSFGSPIRSLLFVSEISPGLHLRLQKCNLFLSSCASVHSWCKSAELICLHRSHTICSRWGFGPQ